MSLGVACPRYASPVCVPLPAWTSLVLCFVPSATHRSVTIHVASGNGWESQPWVSEEVPGRGQFPSPPPRSPNPPRSIFLCRKRTGLNSTHGRERELGIVPLDQTTHPHSSHLGAAARQGPERLGALRSAPPTSPRDLPPRPPAQRAWWELSVQDYKPSSAPAREGRAHPDSRSMSPFAPPLPAPALGHPPTCQRHKLTFSSPPPLTGACAKPPRLPHCVNTWHFAGPREVGDRATNLTPIVSIIRLTPPLALNNPCLSQVSHFIKQGDGQHCAQCLLPPS